MSGTWNGCLGRVRWAVIDPNLSFTDVDVLVIGPVVAEVSESFDRCWNSELAYLAMALLGREPTRDEVRDRRDALDAFIAGQTESAYQRALRDSDLANELRQQKVLFEWGQANVVQD